MKQKIFLLLGLVIVGFFEVSIYQEFMANHTYYQWMLASWTNWKLFLATITTVLLPLWYIFKKRTFSVKQFFVYILPMTIAIYTTLFVSIKDTIIWWSTGWIILMVNTLLIYFLGMYIILGLTAFGTRLSQKFIRFSQIRWQEMLLNFGIGLWVFLLIIYVLAMMTAFRPWLVWILFLWLGYMIWFMRSSLTNYQTIITDMIQKRRSYDTKSILSWVGIVLLALSLMYYMYGFQMSIIPYSTAWDANHEYMYIPKVLAENHGVLRGNVWPAAMVSGLWHMFIAFFFALIQPIKSWFWIAPDTIAVAMNFLSGVFVLLFGIWLIREVIAYFSKKDENSISTTLGVYTWWAMLLFWLTSGMGAFLVFVDNKTDLGVMALTILALLSGFIFLHHIKDAHERGEHVHHDSLIYVIISGIMFARALMAKPTAFIDVALFGLLLIGLWINIGIALGAWIAIVGLTGILKIGNAPDMLSPLAWKYLVIIWLTLVVLSILFMIITLFSSAHIKRFLTYIVTWWISIIVVLVIFKGSNILIYQITQWTFSPGSFLKSTLLAYQESTPLLATTQPTLLDQQQATDNNALAHLDYEQCAWISFSKEALEEGKILSLEDKFLAGQG